MTPKGFAFIVGAMLFSFSATIHSETFRVGFYPHEHTDRYKEIIEKSYADIGIDVVFIEVPVAERAFFELNSGRYDAEVFRARVSSERYDNIILIEPALFSATVYLVCQTYSTCDSSVLSDPDQYIVAAEPIAKLLGSLLENPIRAQVSGINNVNSVYEMFSRGRFQYALLAVDDAQPYPDSLPTRRVPLTTVETFHIIHNSHADIADELSEAIRVNLGLAQ